jgi:FMN-dependent NADH-azoreductase
VSLKGVLYQRGGRRLLSFTTPRSPEESAMKLLHLIATPRQEGSTTLRVSNAFLAELRKHCPDLEVVTVDLFHDDLPAVAGSNIDVKYNLMAGAPVDPSHQESWQQIERLIEQFVSADCYVVSSPMWNLGIPYALKYYIDCLIQPGYVFRYDDHGVPVPLVTGKRMVCVTSRGGDFSANSPLHDFDFQEPYLRAIFGFIGIQDIEFVNAEPVDVSMFREDALAAATRRARSVATALAPTEPLPVVA